MKPSTWWTADKGEVHKTVIDYVRGIDREQYKIFDRFKKLEALYDPERSTPSIGTNNAYDARFRPPRARDQGRMIENIVSQNINTFASHIATIDVRTTFDTDGADWSEQRRARHREWYTAELIKRYDVIAKCQHATKVGTALKGTGCIKVYRNKFDQLCVDHVRVDNVVVDERAYPDGNPLEMHYREPKDADAFAAEFPKWKREIESARGRSGNRWGGWLPLHRNEILVVESWRLPIGERKHEHYVAGRHTICFDGGDVVDEEFHGTTFPIKTHRYCLPPTGWYGIGMGEELASYQRALNKRNSQIDRQADHNANPIISVPRVDARLSAQTVNTLGTIAVYDGRQAPKVEFGPAVSQDLIASRSDIKSSAQAQSGVSPFALQSRIPARLETGAGVREWTGAKTERFAEQEQGFERFVVDVVVGMLDVCRELGSKAPVMVRRSKFSRRRLDWSNVGADDIRTQIGVAAALSQTRAGRLDRLTELAQVGIIGIDEARRLYRHPDLERETSLYTAAIESVDECFEEIADGAVVMPEPFMNLGMIVRRGQQQFLIWRSRKAPEEILENLRQFVVVAAHYLGKAGAGPAPTAAAAEIGGPDAGDLALPPGPPVGPDLAAAPPIGLAAAPA